MNIHYRRPSVAKIVAIALLSVCFLGIGAAGGQILQKGEWYPPENYPDGFHGWGRISRIDEKEIVIDDSLYALAKSVSFHTPGVSDVPSSWFGTGDTVGWLQNDRGEIVSLWRFE